LELSAVLRPEDPAIPLALGHAYVERGEVRTAERWFKRALAIDADHAPAHADLGKLYLSVGIDDGAEHHSLRALALDPDQTLASQTLAALLEARGEHDAAKARLDAAYARQSLYAEPAKDPRMTVLVLATQSSGNIPYRHLMPARHYSRLVWYMEHARPGQADDLPPHDVVFNTIGDPDLAGPSDGAVRALMAVNTKPWLNHPDPVARTHRHLAPGLLGGLEDVVVPEAVRIHASSVDRLGLLAAAAEAGLATPLLVRPTGSHGGKGLVRADTDEALAALDVDFRGGDVYLTRYHDYRSPDGRYRKGRMIFIDRRPYPYHWAISDRWLVHYESAGMGGDPVRQAEERRFLEDPASVIGARAAAAIARIGERLDLDYAGLDFTLLPDGRVLVFEANATMLVHPEPDGSELDYKNPAVTRIVEAFQARLAMALKSPSSSETA
jgi:tetratricopeptide (TPR) repeat protein